MNDESLPVADREFYREEYERELNEFNSKTEEVLLLREQQRLTEDEYSAQNTRLVGA